LIDSEHHITQEAFLNESLKLKLKKEENVKFVDKVEQLYRDIERFKEKKKSDFRLGLDDQIRANTAAKERLKGTEEYEELQRAEYLKRKEEEMMALEILLTQRYENLLSKAKHEERFVDWRLKRLNIRTGTVFSNDFKQIIRENTPINTYAIKQESEVTFSMPFVEKELKIGANVEVSEKSHNQKKVVMHDKPILFVEKEAPLRITKDFNESLEYQLSNYDNVMRNLTINQIIGSTSCRQLRGFIRLYETHLMHLFYAELNFENEIRELFEVFFLGKGNFSITLKEDLIKELEVTTNGRVNLCGIFGRIFFSFHPRFRSKESSRVFDIGKFKIKIPVITMKTSKPLEYVFGEYESKVQAVGEMLLRIKLWKIAYESNFKERKDRLKFLIYCFLSNLEQYFYYDVIEHTYKAFFSTRYGSLSTVKKAFSEAIDMIYKGVFADDNGKPVMSLIDESLQEGVTIERFETIKRMLYLILSKFSSKVEGEADKEHTNIGNLIDYLQE
jgi:hypothetical protein